MYPHVCVLTIHNYQVYIYFSRVKIHFKKKESCWFYYFHRTVDWSSLVVLLVYKGTRLSTLLVQLLQSNLTTVVLPGR